MKTILEYLIILHPLIWEQVTDYIRIEKKNKEDNHRADIPVRFALCLLAGVLLKLFFGVETVFQGALYSGAAFILFDPIQNILRGKNLFHKGKNEMDTWWGQTPPHVEIFIRGWIIAVAVIIYYQFEETIFNFIKW